MNTLRRARASALALTAVSLSVALTAEGASVPPPAERVAAHLAMTVLSPGGMEEATAPVPQMTTPPPSHPAPPVPAAEGAPRPVASDRPDPAEPRRIIPFGSVIARAAADGAQGGPDESAEDAAAKSALEAADAADKKASKGKGRSRRAARASRPWRKRLGFQWPVHGWVTSHFGPRRSGFHHGVDVACRRGIKVRTAKRGKVLVARVLPVYGKTVVVQHPGGYTTLYGHMNRLFVRPGQRVHDRRVIGACGSTGNSTGNHVHFELRYKGRYLKPGHYLPSR